MRKSAVRILLCCLGLLLTAGLVFLFPGKEREEMKAPAPALIRVWTREGESDLYQWLRKRAAAYEKETKARVYIRFATQEEAQAAMEGRDDLLKPDLLLFPGEGEIAALRGYALILRDGDNPVSTPPPTYSLFTRPSPTPAPIPTPAPLTDADQSRPALAPPGCAGALPHTVVSLSPLSDFLEGKADAALLTAGEAAQLPFGYRAYALPDGRGMARFGARALSPGGDQFLRFLLSRPSQQALSEQGLFSPRYPLYQGRDSLSALIESGWNFPD